MRSVVVTMPWRLPSTSTTGREWNWPAERASAAWRTVSLTPMTVGAGLHDGADAELVVEEGVNGALVLAEGLEAQLEEVGGADDADDAAAIDDGDVVKLPFSEELSDIGELLGQVNGDDIGGHNVRDGFISLH